MDTPERTYGGVSAEERRARRRRLLLEAGLDVFGSEGGSAATMTEVCARAKLTERYFYESFADLDTLLVAVFDGVAAEAAEVVLAAVEDSPQEARDRARAAIGAFVEFLTDDPRKARVVFVEGLGTGVLMRRRFEAISSFATLLADQARAFYGPPANADRAIVLTSFMLVGGLAETLIAWLGGELELTRDELIEETTDFFVSTGEAAIRRSAGGPS